MSKATSFVTTVQGGAGTFCRIPRVSRFGLAGACSVIRLFATVAVAPPWLNHFHRDVLSELPLNSSSITPGTGGWAFRPKYAVGLATEFVRLAGSCVPTT